MDSIIMTDEKQLLRRIFYLKKKKHKYYYDDYAQAPHIQKNSHILFVRIYSVLSILR